MQVESILCARSGDAARGSGLRHAIRLARYNNAHLAGAFEHSKFAHDIFWFVTKDVLSASSVPVLMAH